MAILDAQDVEQGPVAVLQFQKARRGRGARHRPGVRPLRRPPAGCRVLRQHACAALPCGGTPHPGRTGTSWLATPPLSPAVLQPIPSGLHGCWADACYAPA